MKAENFSLQNLWKVLLTLTLLVYGLSAAKTILVPFVFAAFLSLVLNPMVQFLESKKIPSWLSIILTLLLVSALLFGGLFFFSSQAKNLISDVPNLMGKFHRFLDLIENEIGSIFGIYGKDQIGLIKENSASIISSGTGFLSNALMATSSLVSFLTLIPIYIVFMLLSRSTIRSFLIELGKRQNKNYVKVAIEIKNMVHNYIGGLLIVTSIITVLNTIGLLSLGIEHAIFLGVFSGCLTVIPYVGIMVGGALPVLVALITEDSLFYPLAVIALIGLVQFLEGNFITPKTMGNKININPLAAIVALLIGASIWGVVGMILAIPSLGIVKIIFSKIDGLKPYAILLSSEEELAD